MSSPPVSEKTIVEALHQVPAERWGEVLHFLVSLQSAPQQSESAGSIHTGTDLVGSELIGIWADRTDLGDSQAFARRLRKQASSRGLNN